MIYKIGEFMDNWYMFILKKIQNILLEVVEIKDLPSSFIV